MATASVDKVLLNNILVDFTNQLICRDEEAEPVDAQGLKVLACLLAHHPETVTREQLLDEAWQGLVVSDNSLSQCITLLRKSLGDDPKASTFIRTVPRKGYQLVATLGGLEQHALVPKTTRLTFNKTQLITLALGLCTVAAIIIGLRGWVLTQSNLQAEGDIPEKLLPSNELYIPSQYLSSNPGVEAFLKFSPSGNRLAYSERSGGQDYNLVLLNLPSNSHQVILNSSADEYVADWSPNGQWLAYTRQTKVQCEIRIKFLGNDESSSITANDQLLTACPRTDFPPSVSWTHDNDIFLTRETEGEYSLIKISMQFDSVTNQFAIGSERVIANLHPDAIDLSPDNQFLLVSEVNHQELRFTLSRLNLESMVVERISEQKNPFWGISWYDTNNTILHGGQLTQLDLSGQATVLYHSSNYIVDLDYHPSGKLVVSEGSANFNLHRIHINPNASERADSVVIVPSTQVDFLPAITVKEDQLAFVSSRNTRKNLGVWLTELPNTHPVLLKSLPTGFLPISLQWAPDDKSLLITSNQRQVYRLSMLTRKLTALNEKNERAFYPHWLNDGKHVRYNLQQNNEWARVTVNAKTAEKQLSIAKTAVLYQLKDGREIGFNQTNHTIVVEEKNKAARSLFNYRNPDELSFTEQGIYYFSDTADSADIYFYEFESDSARKVSTTNASVDFAGTPRNISASSTSLIVPRAGQHQVDLVLLETK